MFLFVSLGKNPAPKYVTPSGLDLPPERLAEVEDFIDFLSQKDRERHVRRDFARGAGASFQKVWDNEDDAAYDKL